MKVKVICKVCNKEEYVIPARAKGYKTCSRKCMGIRQTKLPNATCVVCGNLRHVKPFVLGRVKHGWTCSKQCFAERQRTVCRGEGNHQFGLTGQDNASFTEEIVVRQGYIHEAVYEHPFMGPGGRVRQHRLVAEGNCLFPQSGEFMDAYILYAGSFYLKPDYDVHHNDGNTLNNEPDNLTVLTRGEHTALHNSNKQIIRDNTTGRITGVIKLGEFRETPEVDNPEPSLSN